MGVFSTMGNIMSTMRDIVSTVGVFNTVGDIMINVGISLVPWRCSVPWGISGVPWGLSSVLWGIQYRGGYHDAFVGYMSTMEGIQYHGGNLLLFEYPMVLNTPTVLMISLHMYHDIPHSTQISKDGIPHSTEDPHGTHDIPPCAL